MGYRKLEKKKRKPNRSMHDTTTLSKTFVQNGATAYLAIPCLYVEVNPPHELHLHDRDHDDHVGWPSPDHPDRSCQAFEHVHKIYPHLHIDHHEEYHHPHMYLDMNRVHPIHLTKEGYKDIKVAFNNAPEGLTYDSHIDEREDWVVRVLFDAQCQDAINEKLEVEYSVFATGVLAGRGKVSDVVSRGKLVILPGPIGE